MYAAPISYMCATWPACLTFLHVYNQVIFTEEHNYEAFVVQFSPPYFYLLFFPCSHTVFSTLFLNTLNLSSSLTVREQILLTLMKNNFIQQSPPWEANKRSASQEIPKI
jgi:hypothetical protein